MPACKLTPVYTAGCDWTATAGPVTLELKSVQGTVAFEPKSKYSDGLISFDTADRVSFTIVPGKSTLCLAYVFSDTDKGSGTLCEACDQSTALDDVNAGNPAVQYIICA